MKNKQLTEILHRIQMIKSTLKPIVTSGTDAIRLLDVLEFDIKATITPSESPYADPEEECDFDYLEANDSPNGY